MSGTRSPVLAGAWYPADPRQLGRDIDGYLDGADPDQSPTGRPLVAVVPHAGYIYSGPTAGRVFGLLADAAVSTVFILAPNHRMALDRIALPGATAFATPLGNVPVAAEIVADLAQQPAFTIDDGAHAAEHAVEIQLPFLQRIWPNRKYSIVPLLVPRLPENLRLSAAQALRRLAGPETLIVVSSDFTHYGAAYGYVPFTRKIPESLEKLDTGALLKILAGDAAGLLDYGRTSGITMCGLEATAVALGCGLPAGYEGALLDYRRSGDRDRDYSMSVSYAAVLLSSGTGATSPSERDTRD